MLLRLIAILIAVSLALPAWAEDADAEDAKEKAQDAAKKAKSMETESMAMAAQEFATMQFDKAILHLQQYQAGKQAEDKNKHREKKAEKYREGAGAAVGQVQNGPPPEHPQAPDSESSSTSNIEPELQQVENVPVAAPEPSALPEEKKEQAKVDPEPSPSVLPEGSVLPDAKNLKVSNLKKTTNLSDVKTPKESSLPTVQALTAPPSTGPTDNPLLSTLGEIFGKHIGFQEEKTSDSLDKDFFKSEQPSDGGILSLLRGQSPPAHAIFYQAIE